MHVDSEGAIDWAGVTDPTLRVLPEDPTATGVVRLPGETALATWVAHRCHRSLQPVLDELERRGQAVLDALMCFVLPVRAPRWRPEGCRDPRSVVRTDPAYRTRGPSL
jgi:hypothetical protein